MLQSTISLDKGIIESVCNKAQEADLSDVNAWTLPEFEAWFDEQVLPGLYSQ